MDASPSIHLARAEQLVQRYLEHLREHSPVEATRLGIPGRDGELPDLDPDALGRSSRDRSVLAAEVRLALEAIGPDPVGADREARDDLRLLADELEYRRYLLDLRPRWVFDPLAALDTIAASIHSLLAREETSRRRRRERLEAAAQRARRIPVLLEQAGSLLVSAPGPHLRVALRRLPSLIELVSDSLPRRAEELGVDISPARDAGEVAAEGLEAYGALLDELGAQGQWRLGPEDHGLLLRTAVGTELSATTIDSRAQAWQAALWDELEELSARGWSRRFPGQRRPHERRELIARTLDSLGDLAVTADQLIPEARAAVEEARAFALATRLTDVPPADRLSITEVPPYLQGLSVAFVTQAAPLDPAAGCTYYLAPVPPGVDAEQQRAFLREYNAAQLRSLAVHEGYPGHFVQLEHAAQHPRLARRVLARPAFAEGWAVYIERQVLAAGFGYHGTSRVDGDDLRLTHRKLELRLAMNARLDVELHAGSGDEDRARQWLREDAFEDRDDADAKLVRAQIAPGQLSSYFAGATELMDLRDHVEASQGAGFDLRAFHQQVLSHGTPTVSMIGAALADDAPSWRPFRASA